MLTTPVTLLENLINNPDHRLWSDFYAIYWKTILNYCRKQGLSDSDSRDVLQETMLTLFKHLSAGGFRYNQQKGKFRNFLFTVVRNKVIDAFRRAQNRKTFSLDVLSDNAALIQDGGLKPEEMLEKDWQYSLVESALERLYLAPGVDRKTVDAFVDYVVHGMAVAEVACKYAIKENAVYQIKNRMIKRLKQEVAILSKISNKFNKI